MRIMPPVRRNITLAELVFLTVLVLITTAVSQASAQTVFYVDPDWTGNKNGTAGAPWNRLANAEWEMINAALKKDDVTIFFSAREATIGVNQATDYNIKILRTDTSSHRLTLDGNSKYNSNDTNPSWQNNITGARFHITANYPITTTNSAPIKRSYVTVRGFRVTSTGGQGIYYWGGDHVIIENNIINAQNPSHGPGLFFNYAREREHNENPCVPDTQHNCGCQDITIKNNTVYQIYGEGIYVGGVNEFCVGSGTRICPKAFPSHDTVIVEGNTVYDIGYWGGEADGIDIKNGITNLLVKGNTVYMTMPGTGRDGIVLNSGGIFENNFVSNFGRNGITLGVVWNTYPTRDSTVVRNNILAHNGGGAYSWSSGLRVSGDPVGDNWTNVLIHNNTIVSTLFNATGSSGEGIYIESGASGARIFNNLMYDNAGPALNIQSLPEVSEHEHNLFYGSHVGVEVKVGTNEFSAAKVNGFEASAIVANPLLWSTATPYAPQNFRPIVDSPAVDMGHRVSSSGADYFGQVRDSIWDIGAIEYSGATPPSPPETLLPPKNLKVTPK